MPPNFNLITWLEVAEDALTNRINPGSLAGALVYLILFFVAGWVSTRLVRHSLRAATARDGQRRLDPMAVGFLQELAVIAIWVVTVVLYAQLIPSLRSLGTALLAGASVVSIVLGLAAQNTLGNVVAGMALLLYRPFRIGDRLQVTAATGIETGTVESMSLGYTVLKTFDNRRIVLPNSGIANQVTVNLSSIDASVMASVPISIAYGSDIDAARALLLSLVEAHRDAKEPFECPVVALSPSGVDLSLRFWCADAGAAAQTRFDILELAANRLPQSGFVIPYPTTNIVLARPSNAVQS
jgi:small conductance mechanosensitive channel